MSPQPDRNSKKKARRAKRSLRPLVNLISAALVLALMAFMSGPLFVFKPSATSPAEAAVEKAGDLERYLRDQEDQVHGIKRGLAKGVVWHNPERREKTKLAIIYLHGFSASRAEMSPVFEKLAQDLGANIYFTRLKAHGLKSGEGFASVKPQDWIDDAREALAIGHRLGEKVLVVGMSTGAILALELAHEKRTENWLAGLVLISPNFHPKDPLAKFISGPLGAFWARVFIGFHREFKTENAEHAEYWTARYRSEGIVALMDLLNFATHLDLREIRLPILVLYTKKDNVVSVPHIERRFRELGSERKELVELVQVTRHEFASQWLAPEAVEPTRARIKAFVRTL